MTVDPELEDFRSLVEAMGDAMLENAQDASVERGEFCVQVNYPHDPNEVRLALNERLDGVGRVIDVEGVLYEDERGQALVLRGRVLFY
jgi:hypothetical protein